MKVLFFICLICFLFKETFSFADWMLDGPYCDRKLELGEIIMNSPVIQGLTRTNDPKSENYIGIRLYRGDELLLPLSTGKYSGTFGEIQPTYTFKPSEVLQVHYAGYSNGEIVYEINGGGGFLHGGCDDRRASNYYDEFVKLEMDAEIDENEEITIVAGWAEAHSSVSISRTIYLIPESSLSESNEEKVQIKQEDPVPNEIENNVASDEIKDTEIKRQDPHANYIINEEPEETTGLRKNAEAKESDRK